MPEQRKNPNYQASLFSVVSITGEGDEREFLVNYSNHDVKVWFTKTMIWALTNARVVSITRATERDIQTRPLFTPRPEAVS